MKKILIQIGYFILELGIKILADAIFGKKNKKRIFDMIDNVSNENMTGKQKYDEVKGFVDGLKDGVPDSIKNIVIEGLVTQSTKALKRLKD
jgi:hypothetical protein